MNFDVSHSDDKNATTASSLMLSSINNLNLQQSDTLSNSNAEQKNSFDWHIKSQHYRTKLCPYYFCDTRCCIKGNDCNFAHSRDELRAIPIFWKTKICDTYMKGNCKNSNCHWAHGRHELQATNAFYKTSLCKYWLNQGCFAGSNCRHAHGEEDLRKRNLEIHDFYVNLNSNPNSTFNKHSSAKLKNITTCKFSMKSTNNNAILNESKSVNIPLLDKADSPLSSNIFNKQQSSLLSTLLTDMECDVDNLSYSEALKKFNNKAETESCLIRCNSINTILDNELTNHNLNDQNDSNSKLLDLFEDHASVSLSSFGDASDTMTQNLPQKVTPFKLCKPRMSSVSTGLSSCVSDLVFDDVSKQCNLPILQKSGSSTFSRSTSSLLKNFNSTYNFDENNLSVNLNNVSTPKEKLLNAIKNDSIDLNNSSEVDLLLSLINVVLSKE